VNVDNLSSIGATIGGGFFAGVLIGYTLKKVVKVLAVVVGLFIAGLAYLQYQQIVSINWNKFQLVIQSAVSTLAYTTAQIPGFSNASTHPTALAISDLGIPLTGSMSFGFAIGFMKG